MVPDPLLAGEEGSFVWAKAAVGSPAATVAINPVSKTLRRDASAWSWFIVLILFCAA
jgi:hypothetical protein